MACSKHHPRGPLSGKPRCQLRLTLHGWLHGRRNLSASFSAHDGMSKSPEQPLSCSTSTERPGCFPSLDTSQPPCDSSFAGKNAYREGHSSSSATPRIPHANIESHNRFIPQAFASTRSACIAHRTQFRCRRLRRLGTAKVARSSTGPNFSTFQRSRHRRDAGFRSRSSSRFS